MGKKSSKPSPFLLSRGEHSSPGTRCLIFFCLRYRVTGVEVLSTRAHSCCSDSFFRVAVALALDILEEGAGQDRGARGKPTSPLTQSKARRPAHSLPAKNTVVSHQGAKPCSAAAEAEAGGPGAGEACGEKGIFREYTGPARSEYYSFSVCSLTNQSFLLIFAVFWGRESTHPFFF